MAPLGAADRAVEGSGSAQEATTEALRRAETTPAVSRHQGPAEAGTVAAPGGAFAPVSLDLRLVIPDILVLRGKKLRPGGPTGASLGDINLTVGGDLQVVKPAGGQVVLLGTVQTVRGSYEFQGRRFDLQRGGTLRFLGEPQPNPALDIVATRVIPNTRGSEVAGPGHRQGAQGRSPAIRRSRIGHSRADRVQPAGHELGSGGGVLAATARIATGSSRRRSATAACLDLDLLRSPPHRGRGPGRRLTWGSRSATGVLQMRQQFGERNITSSSRYQLADFLRSRRRPRPKHRIANHRQRRIRTRRIDLSSFQY